VRKRLTSSRQRNLTTEEKKQKHFNHFSILWNTFESFSIRWTRSNFLYIVKVPCNTLLLAPLNVHLRLKNFYPTIWVCGWVAFFSSVAFLRFESSGKSWRVDLLSRSDVKRRSKNVLWSKRRLNRLAASSGRISSSSRGNNLSLLILTNFLTVVLNKVFIEYYIFWMETSKLEISFPRTLT